MKHVKRDKRIIFRIKQTVFENGSKYDQIILRNPVLELLHLD